MYEKQLEALQKAQEAELLTLRERLKGVMSDVESRRRALEAKVEDAEAGRTALMAELVDAKAFWNDLPSISR